MTFSKFEKLLLTCITYTSMIGNAAVPTWRVVNILFVFASLLRLKKVYLNAASIQIFIFSSLLFLVFLFQAIFLYNKDSLDGYGISFLIATFFLLVFTNLFFQYCINDFNNVLKVVRNSIYLLFSYQIYQILAFYLLDPSYVLILNTKDILESSNVFRLIGPFIGPPSFMAESGHLALYAGPFLLSCLVLERKEKLQLSTTFKIICFLHLILTFSGGAFIYLIFSILVNVNLRLNKILGFIQYFVVFFLVAFGFSKLNPEYVYLIQNKVNSILLLDSPRFDGAWVFIDVFKDNVLFGLNFKSSRFVNADPNMFLPVMLSDHGIVGTSTLLVLLIVPFLFTSQMGIYLPYFAMLLHLFFSYGTFTWPMIWINYCIMVTIAYKYYEEVKFDKL